MARDFSGTAQYLSGAFAVATAVPASMACWFNPDATTNRVLMTLSDATRNNGFEIQVGSAIVARTNAGGNNSQATATGTVAAGKWFHAGVVFASATDRRAFYNGGGKGTNATSRVPTGITTTDVGRDGAGGNLFDGRIAEVAIWNIDLSDADVADLAKGFSPLLIKRRWLVAYYPLLGRQSGREIDLIGGRHLTVTGATQAAHPRILTAEDVMMPHVPAVVAAGFIPYPRPRGLEGGLSVMMGGMA